LGGGGVAAAAVVAEPEQSLRCAGCFAYFAVIHCADYCVRCSALFCLSQTAAAKQYEDL
jgi:hypothetical protein